MSDQLRTAADDAASPEERCENRSRPGVVAGQQCGLELDHHGPCFWTGEFSVHEVEGFIPDETKELTMDDLDKRHPAPTVKPTDECEAMLKLEAQCTLPVGHECEHDYEMPREVADSADAPEGPWTAMECPAGWFVVRHNPYRCFGGESTSWMTGPEALAIADRLNGEPQLRPRTELEDDAGDYPTFSDLLADLRMDAKEYPNQTVNRYEWYFEQINKLLRRMNRLDAEAKTHG